MSFALTLISVDISSNYVEYGDILYVTAKWQNTGTGCFSSGAKIAADLLFDMKQRHLENQPDGFRFTWTPYPELFQLNPGEVFLSTGQWAVPVTWCGTFSFKLSIIADNGEAVRFIGMENKAVYSEYIADIDLGWGWGRKMLEATRKPLFIKINDEMPVQSDERSHDVFQLGRFCFAKSFPAIAGIDSLKWRAEPPVIYYRSKENNRWIRCIADERPVYSAPIIDQNEIRYQVNGIFGKFDIVFSFKNSFKIFIDNVAEKHSYELISVYFPKLYHADQDSTLVNFFCGGREVKISETLPTRAEFPYDVCSAVAVYDKNCTVVLITDDTEIKLYQSVGQDKNKKYGALGAEIFYRIAAEKPGLESIPADPLPLELHIFSEGNWQCAAAHMQRRLLNNNKGLYNHTLFYKICVDTTLQHNQKNPQTLSETLGFADVKKIIKEIFNVTNGMKQVVYLVGWQAGGHDTEYPYPYKNEISSRVGTDEDWEDARQFARQNNAILSFHDNFDDAYVESNPGMANVAIDKKGEYSKGWLWAGGMTYILSQKAYNLSGEMENRVKNTVSRFNIEDSYHLDVLTSEVRRYDFSQEYRSASRENIEYKKKIIESFNNLGIDVTSESLAMPFAGCIGYALHTRYNFNEVLFPAEKVIPITTMIYHGIIPYNMGSGNEDDILKAVAYGANCGMDIEKGHIIGINQTRSIFLHTMPMHLLENFLVTECISENDHISIKYENNSYVEVDFKQKTYSIIVNGEKVGWNYNSVIPGLDSYFVYSVSGGRFNINLPGDWSRVKTFTLSVDNKTEIGTYEVKSTITLDIQPDIPVLIQKI